MKEWTRKDLKGRAKAGLKLYYLQAFIVSVILGLLGIGWTSANSSGAAASGETDNLMGELFAGLSEEELVAAVAAILIAMLGVILISSLIGLVIRIFVWNVIKIGGCRFYLENQKSAGTVDYKELLWGFRCGSYGNIIKTMFLRDIKVALWTILLIIPGVVKAYEYRMLPYILSENPDISSSDAFAETRRMMEGNKWRSFVLDFSFIGWKIVEEAVNKALAVIPVLGPILAKIPGRCLAAYMDATEAELYMALKD